MQQMPGRGLRRCLGQEEADAASLRGAAFGDGGEQSTDLLHDAGLALGKGNVSARLVADELDLNLAALASALLVIVVVVVGRRSTLALDAARLGWRAAIANRVGVVEVGGRALVVLIGDVGHDCE